MLNPGPEGFDWEGRQLWPEAGPGFITGQFQIHVG